MVTILDIKLIFGIVDNTAIMLADSINNKEYGDIRSILDEYIPKPPYWMISNIVSELYRHTGATYYYSSFDGWSYTE